MVIYLGMVINIWYYTISDFFHVNVQKEFGRAIRNIYAF